MPSKPRPRAGATTRAASPMSPRPAAGGKTAKFAVAFAALREIFERQSKHLLVMQDGPGGYQVSLPLLFRGKPFWFGAVRRGKSYVSFHLMAVYAFPDLLEEISPALRKRMQGKSCFNFRDADPQLLRELEALTKAGLARMKKDGPAQLAIFEKR